ncbi:hypothetical protein M9194_02300 [Vibrio sp. S4M6]|uniref:hypothetical protein n=1 Tax=Vibrio sinus TaxID=2946865 RepID=UPI00202A5831|nr:hypothetical protein [Vibrio sinus]MCL9780262.1 hypothetical protein [Vibrio sinus]
MKKSILSLLAISALASASVFAATSTPTNATAVNTVSSTAITQSTGDVQFKVTPMSNLTNVTVSENGHALSNYPVQLKGATTTETFTTDKSGTFYIPAVTHANKSYTLLVKNQNGQVFKKTVFISDPASNN